MNDGMIELDTPNALELGFTSDKFEGYLWKKEDAIVISFIISKARGNFRTLVQRIHALGYTVQIPTPLGRMQEIVLKNGYTHSQVPFSEEDPDLVDLWSLEAPESTESVEAHPAPHRPQPETQP